MMARLGGRQRVLDVLDVLGGSSLWEAHAVLVQSPGALRAGLSAGLSAGGWAARAKIAISDESALRGVIAFVHEIHCDLVARMLLRRWL